MSRVGKNPIPLPAGTKVKIDDGWFSAEGPKGKVTERLVDSVDVEITDSEIRVTRKSDEREDRAKHGLMRALLANAVNGASTGFRRELEINGVGYKAEVKGKEIHLALGYSHPVVYAIPDGIEIEVDKNNKVTIQGASKQQVGQVAAEIRSLRKPEPYKGKGIKYVEETIRRKVGKAGAAAGA
ncbi:MAG: 50S ribosomal protein L6 [Acidimicrobiia bacterium]|nr:50S ribosomal protein L6 [Acidimicrobiia bacterium]